MSAADRLAADAAVRTREIRAAYHGAGAYVFAALTVDIAALRLPPATVYAVILYFMMGLRLSAAAFFTFLVGRCRFTSIKTRVESACGFSA